MTLMASSLNADGSDSVNDPPLIQSPTHVFPHNLPENFVIDVDPTTVVNNPEDHSNALSDYQSVYIPQFSPPRSNADDNPDLHSGEIPHLSPPPSHVDANLDLHSGEIPHFSPPLSHISGTLLENIDIRSSLHRLVWSVFIKPPTFENRWHEIIQSPQSVLRSEILDLRTECVDVLRGDTNALTEFANKLKEIISNILDTQHRE
ncbi:hypothetical protein L1987_37994 [Smallanthus sonchifolius]|uniref:Uncharacterized protein n=1 Tax=Smallanthus sonchifolius TaxID=185202 RepID=A0ACB9HKG6_9ASTR|nr:hypothetical protein L1987_37994 [Smallanthus sonchifolius]